MEGGVTYKAHEDPVSGLDGDLTTIVINSGRGGGFPVRTKGSIETDSFQAVMKQLIIRLWGVFLGKTVYLREMCLPFLRQIEVEDLGELVLYWLENSAMLGEVRKTYYLGLVWNHCTSRGKDVGPGYFRSSETVLKKLLDHMGAIGRQPILVRAEVFDNTRQESGATNGLDVGFNHTAELLRD